MSDRCEPPAGAEDGSLHWLESGDPDAFVEHEAAEWSGGSPYQGAGWYFPGSQRRDSPQHVAALGYRYLAPVTPPDEVARLRADLARAIALIEDLRPGLGDEGPPWNAEGLDTLRARVAAALAAIKERTP